jgi:hypothetical protein
MSYGETPMSPSPKIAIVMNNGAVYRVENAAGPMCDFDETTDPADAVAAIFRAIGNHDPIYVESAITPPGIVGHAARVVYPVLANVSAVVELR